MRVAFSADGVEIAGTLLAPADARAAIALTGPFTGVKDQVTGHYAERLTDAGYATLAIDHRGFGESGGRRGHEDTQGKLSDLRAAVGYLAERYDRVALVGICLGGGYAMRAAATDPRVAAVAGIAGAYNSPAWFAEQMGGENYRGALASFISGYDDRIPAVAPGGAEAAMQGDEPYRYYGTERSASAHWSNEVTRGSLHSLMTFDALSAAELLYATPSLIVHGRVDAYCSPELATAMHTRIPNADKEIVWLDTTEHIDLYDVEPHVNAAVAATARFLDEHL